MALDDADVQRAEQTMPFDKWKAKRDAAINAAPIPSSVKKKMIESEDYGEGEAMPHADQYLFGTRDNPLIQPGPGGAPVGARDVPGSADKNRFWNADPKGEGPNIAPYNAPGITEDRVQQVGDVIPIRPGNPVLEWDWRPLGTTGDRLDRMLNEGITGYSTGSGPLPVVRPDVLPDIAPANERTTGGRVRLQGGGDPDAAPPPAEHDDWITPPETKAAAPAEHDDWITPGAPAKSSAEPPQWKEPAPEPVGTTEEPFEPANEGQYTQWLQSAPVGSRVKLPTGELWTKPQGYEAPPSATKAFMRGAGAGAGPAAAGLAGFGLGAELGAEAGAFGGPFAWATVPAGALIGGTLGALGGGWLGSKAQEKVVAALPQSAQEAIGQSPAQIEAAQKAHPYAFEAGTFAPNVLAFSPFSAERAATEGATTLEKLMAHPVTARAVPAAVMAAQDAVQQTLSGQPIDPGSLALAAGAGALMQRETAFGRALINAGARPVQTVFGHVPGAPQAIARAAAGEPPPPPATGETIGMDLGRGVEAATVTGTTPHGDVELTDADGTKHTMTAADVARLRTDVPQTAPQAPTTEAPPAQGATRPVVTPGTEEPATRTIEDLDREAAEERAAAAGQPPATPPEARIQAAEAELAAQAQPQGRAPTPEELIRSIGGPPEPLPPRPAPAPEAPAPAPQAPPARVEPARAPDVEQGTPAQHTEMTDNRTGQKYTIDPNPGGGFDIDAGPLGILYTKTYQGALDQVRSLVENPGAAHRAPELANAPEPTPQQPAPVTADEARRLEALRAENAEPVAPPSGNFYQRIEHAQREREQPAPHGTEPPPEQTPPESATPVEPTPPPPAAPAALPAPSRGDIGRVAEELFNAYRQGGPDAARDIFNRYQNTWPLAATEAVRAQFQSLIEGTGKPWSEVQAEAGRAPEPTANTPTITDEVHTKTGKPIFAVRFPTKPEIADLGAQARKLGGYWSSFRGGGMQPGWMFKTREAADRFAAWARGEAPPPTVREQVQAAPSPVEDTSGFIDHVENIVEQAANPQSEPVREPTPGTRPPEEVAADVAEARESTEPHPTAEQLEADTAPKGKVDFHGIPFQIETPAGVERHGVDADGKPWTVRMPDGVDYGEIRRTEGMDGDPVDMFLGPDHASQKVWIVDQVHADTKDPDEHKILAGFPDETSARAAYEASFSDGRGADRIGAITPTDLDGLKTWLKHGDTTEPVAPSGPAPQIGEPIPVRDLGPPAVEPRPSRIATGAPTTAALEASMRRRQETEFRPKLSSDQKAEAANARNETARRFDDAITDVENNPPPQTLSDWRQEVERWAQQRYPAKSRESQRKNFVDGIVAAAQGRTKFVGRDAETWLKAHPYPNVGTVPVTLTTARGRETRLVLPRDAEIIDRVKKQYLALDPDLYYGLAEDMQHFAPPPFFSALTRAVEAIPQAKAPGAQWANLIRNLSQKGVKQDEIDWSGVQDWLKDHPGLVTKDQLLAELRANEVQVQEVHRGTPTEPPDIAAKRERFQNLIDQHEQSTENHRLTPALTEAEYDEMQRLSEELNQHRNPWLDTSREARYAGYNLRGGENYRELLLTLPTKGQPLSYPEPLATLPEGYEVIRDSSQPVGRQYGITPPGQVHAGPLGRRRYPTADAAKAGELQIFNENRNEAAAKAWRDANENTQYRSGHWDEPNVLAHIRMDDRTDPDGKKVLHVAEIQSDWHQQGRRRGYNQGEPLVPPLTIHETEHQWVALDEQGREWGAVGKGTVSGREEAAEYLNRYINNREVEAARDRNRSTVPDAPFKTQWPELAMKRVLRYAAENGYDRVSWDTGDTQADRYDLSKHVDHISYAKDGPDTWTVSARKDNRELLGRRGQTPDQIGELLGKDIADKIIGGTGHEIGAPDGSGELRGLDLKVGGEGMRGFYDKILPTLVNKYTKKWGTKVEPSTVDAATDHYNYEGPVNFAGEDLQRINRTVSTSAALERQWRDVRRATVGGYTVAEAMRAHGSSALAEILGGKMIEKPTRAPVHAVDVTPQMRESVMRGQPLWEGTGAATSGYRDTLSDYHQFAAGREPSHELSRDYVLDRGQATGNEHLTLNDPNGVLAASTSDLPNAVRYDQVGLDHRLMDPDAQLVIHHNHPINHALSKSDIGQLAYPGVSAVVAHAHDGSMYSMSLTPEASQWLRQAGPDMAMGVLKAAYTKAMEDLRPALQHGVDKGFVSPDRASSLLTDMTNRALDAAGLVDYVSPHTGDPIPDGGRFHITQAAQAVANSVFKIPGGEDIAHRIDRSTRRVQPDEGMAGLPRAAGNTPQERGGIGSDQGRAPGTVATGAEGLAEENGLFSDHVDDTFAEPVRQVEDRFGPPPQKPPPPGLSNRFLRFFGAGRGSPGRDERWMNPAEKELIAPSNAGRYNLGGVSRQKFQAEENLRLRKETLLSSYKDDLKPWSGLGKDDQELITAANELLRLQGRDVPLDGRAVIVQNDNHALAQNSRPGDTIRLTTPTQIAGFAAYRKAMAHIYSDYVSATAKRWGWDGDPHAAAIQAEADRLRDEGQNADAKRLDRVAKIVGLAEYAERTAYTPFMRQGDYFFRVTPKPGTPDREGVPGWNGEGFPPTVWYSRIDSRLPEEKVAGGARTGSQTADAYRAELQRTFSDDQYRIEEGYYHPSEDRLRDMDIESIEDLFQVVNRDFQREWRDRIRASDDPEAMRTAAQQAQELHEQAVDALLDSVYERLKAGFKKQALNIPGYEKDLAKTTAIYANWLASHVSELENRDAIRAADAAVDRSYDPVTKEFWHDWDRAQDRSASPLDWGLSRVRQGAFYWTLGASASSTLKILLHSPMMGFPVLSTGFGGVGRAQVAATYLKAFGDVIKGIRANGQEGLGVDLDQAARTPQERALIATNEANGRLHAPGAQELGALRDQGIEALTPQQKFNRRVLSIWASNISAADRTIRGAMLLSAYRTASKPGAMDRINQVWGRDALWRDAPEKTPEAFANFILDRTAGIWGRQNRSAFARSTMGGMLYQFRSYELNFLSALHQQLWHMGPEGKVTAGLMLGGLGMMAGTLGLPFAQDIEGAYEWVHKLVTGVDPNLNQQFLDWSKTDPLGLGQNAGNTILYGIEPFGIDIGPGLSFGDIASRNMQSPLNLLGAAGSIFLGAPMNAYHRMETHQSSASVFAELMPTAIKNLVKAYGVYPQEGVRSMTTGNVVVNPRDITATDQAMRAAGLQPADIGDVYRQNELQYRQSQQHREAAQAFNRQLKGLAESMVLAKQRGDTAAAADLQAQLQQLEASAPTGVKASAKAIRDAEYQAENPQAAAIRHLPKAIRTPVQSQVQP